LAAALQEQIEQQERAIFSPKVLELARHPRNMGAMLDPEGHAVVCGPCGDTMEIFVRLDGAQIQRTVFMTDGCGPTVACGSMLTTMAVGKTLEQATAIEPWELITALGGLPPEHIHCATLAVNTLRQALASVQRNKDTDPD
jgi:nitrogen fixation NifU-like protein